MYEFRNTHASGGILLLLPGLATVSHGFCGVISVFPYKDYGTWNVSSARERVGVSEQKKEPYYLHVELEPVGPQDRKHFHGAYFGHCYKMIYLPIEAEVNHFTRITNCMEMYRKRLKVEVHFPPMNLTNTTGFVSETQMNTGLITFALSFPDVCEGWD